MAINTHPTCPKKTEVVVIGGGIIGCCTAYYLAKAGVDVVLFEKGRIAGEQSSRNWGFIRKQGRHPSELPMTIRAIELWHEITQQLNQDIGFRVGGTLYLSDNEARYKSNLAWLEIAKQHQLDTEFLSSKKLAQLIPALTKQKQGALYTASDACAEPELATQAIAQLAKNSGAKLFTNCAVRGVELAAGKVSHAVTEIGSIACSTVICCNGAWSSYFCSHLGLKIPQLKVTSSVMATAPTTALFDASLWGTGLGMRRRADGGYNIACGGSSLLDITPDLFRFIKDFLPTYRQSKESVNLALGKSLLTELTWPRQWAFDKPTVFEKQRVLNPKPNQKHLNTAYKNLQKQFNALANIQIKQRWAGMIDVTPDELPIISTVPNIPGLIISTGYSGHGFGIAPGAAETTVKLALGENISSEFSLNRLL